jgi:hypothetical protein
MAEQVPEALSSSPTIDLTLSSSRRHRKSKKSKETSDVHPPGELSPTQDVGIGSSLHSTSPDRALETAFNVDYAQLVARKQKREKKGKHRGGSRTLPATTVTSPQTDVSSRPNLPSASNAPASGDIGTLPAPRSLQQFEQLLQEHNLSSSSEDFRDRSIIDHILGFLREGK